MNRKSKMTHGDFRRMVTQELRLVLEDVVNRLAYKRTPYYLHVHVNDHYDGQPAANAVKGQATRDLTIGGQVIHTTVVCFSCNMEISGNPALCSASCKAYMGQREGNRVVCPLSVPQLGTILFRMDNRVGELELIYALPKDKPHAAVDSDNYGPVAEAVSDSAQKAGVPLRWN